MDLVPYIYHEVQDRDGSMLCAQHCLNNLLQQNLYTAMDLADMATDLDRSENATLGISEQRMTSQNMDDTGFFSISVLEKALQVFDLSLVRWRSPEMAMFQERPEDQAAFVLNLASHWLPVRRFASSPNRWYNLNSFLQHPEWISPTYLKMVLQQAEQEGYSVFVVRSLDAHAMQEEMTLSLLPECQADLIGLEMGDPVGRDAGTDNSSTYASVTRSNLPSSSHSQPIQLTQTAPGKTTDLSDPDDLVAASLERSRAALERFQREQAAGAAAFSDPGFGGRSRRRRQADVPDLFGDAVAEQGRSGDEVNAATAGADDVPEVGMTEFDRRRMREEQELEAAIAASLAESEQRETGARDAGLEEVAAPRPLPDPPARLPAGSMDVMEDDDEELDINDDHDDQEEAFDFHHEARLYDDEDAQLQAAINASLQEQSSLPPDWQLSRPDAVVRSVERASVHTEAGQATSVPVLPDNKPSPIDEPAPIDAENEEDVESEPEVHELSAEELRRKRLERFK